MVLAFKPHSQNVDFHDIIKDLAGYQVKKKV